MCGRFTLTAKTEKIADDFGIDEVKDDIGFGYNIAPGRNVAAIIEDGTRRLGLLKWGLIPSWAKDPSIGNRMINARAETLTEKTTFKGLVKRNRCLVVADGFFEWRSEGGQKKPFYIFLKSRSLFAFAGLWDIWTSPDGEKVPTCTIITTKPNNVLKNIHSRMPVILTDKHIDLWLDRTVQDRDQLNSLLKPYPDDEMDFHEVSTKVNSPGNDSAELIRKVG